MITPRTMSGVLELLPRQQIEFQRMIDSIRTVFLRHGFLPIETPAIERLDVLLTKTGGETERQIYLVQSSGAHAQGNEPDLGLPFDLTVPLARFVAEHEHDLAFPFRRHQIQRVYRGESVQRGRFREFYQCDIDVIARNELPIGHDAEVAAVMAEALGALEIGSFTIRLNNRRLMRGLLTGSGVGDPETQTLVLREIDRLDRRPVEDVARAIAALGVPTAVTERVVEVVDQVFEGSVAAEALSNLESRSDEMQEGIDELVSVVSMLLALGVSPDRFVVDLAVARGLDYYTGTVYETRLDDHPQIGSICSGGRYENLAGHYTSTRLPGVGMSIGLTRLFWHLVEAGVASESPSTTLAYVTLMDSDYAEHSLRLAAGLRQEGVATEVAFEASKLGKQLKYADRAGIRFAIIVGSDERERGVVTVRDLVDQSQSEVADAELAAHLMRLLTDEAAHLMRRGDENE